MQLLEAKNTPPKAKNGMKELINEKKYLIKV